MFDFLRKFNSSNLNNIDNYECIAIADDLNKLVAFKLQIFKYQ